MNIQSTLKGQDAVQEIPGLFSSMMGDEEILEEEETRNIFLELHDSNYPKNLSCRGEICPKHWQAVGLRLIEGVTRWVSRN